MKKVLLIFHGPIFQIYLFHRQDIHSLKTHFNLYKKHRISFLNSAWTVFSSFKPKKIPNLYIKRNLNIIHHIINFPTKKSCYAMGITDCIPETIYKWHSLNESMFFCLKDVGTARIDFNANSMICVIAIPMVRKYISWLASRLYLDGILIHLEFGSDH